MRNEEYSASFISVLESFHVIIFQENLRTHSIPLSFINLLRLHG